MVLFIPIIIYFEYIYFETKRVIWEHPEFYSFLKEEAEDYTGKEFNLTTRRGLLKVKMYGDFNEILDEVYQNRLDKLGDISRYNPEQDYGEWQHQQYLYFQTRLDELILRNGIKSGLY